MTAYALAHIWDQVISIHPNDSIMNIVLHESLSKYMQRSTAKARNIFEGGRPPTGFCVTVGLCSQTIMIYALACGSGHNKPLDSIHILRYDAGAYMPSQDNGFCWTTLTGGWINIKMSSYQYRKSHCGDKTILLPSYLHNGISYTGTMTSLYWIRALDVIVSGRVTWRLSIPFSPTINLVC